MISFNEISLWEIFLPVWTLSCGHMVLLAWSPLQGVMMLFLGTRCTSFVEYVSTCYMPGV